MSGARGSAGSEAAVASAIGQIETAIMTAVLPPGASIRAIDLADRFGLDAAACKNAIEHLALHGLLQRTTSAEAKVTDLSVEEADVLYALRAELEVHAVTLATEPMTDRELDDLRALTSASSATTYKQDRNHDFHGKIALCSRDHNLIDLLCGSFYRRLYRYRIRSLDRLHRREQALKEHLAILDAIRDRKSVV